MKKAWLQKNSFFVRQRTPSKKRRLLLIFLLSFLLLALLSSCTNKHTPYYEVVGAVSLATPPPFDFSSLFNQLYDSNTQEVFADVVSVSPGEMEIHVNEVLIGHLFRNKKYRVRLPEQAALPIKGERYLFFLDMDHEDTLTLKTDLENGLLSIENQVVVNEVGSYLSMEKIRNISADKGNTITLPYEFKLYRDLESLVAGCNYIFVGRLEAHDIRQQGYYIESYGSVMHRSSESVFWLISVEEQLKGRFSASEMRVVTAPLMLENTLRNVGGNDSSVLQSADIPPYNDGGRYLFFAIDPPSSDQNAEKFFVNPIQGYVPIIGRSDLLPVYSNPVFATESLLDDVRYDINAIMSSSE